MRASLRSTVFLLGLASLAAGNTLAQQMEVSSASRAAELFAVLDANRDGVLSQYEYDADAVSRLMDDNADKQISTPEFNPLMGQAVDTRTAGRLQVADRNDDGVMSDDEVRSGTFRQFKLLDVNQDGNVDRRELEAGFNVPVVRP